MSISRKSEIKAAVLSDEDRIALSQLAALASQARLRVFRRLIAEGPQGLPAGVLSAELEIAPSGLSAHLTILREAGLAVRRQDGRKRIYAVDLAAIAGLVDYLVSDCCDGHPEVCAPLSQVGRASGCAG